MATRCSTLKDQGNQPLAFSFSRLFIKKSFRGLTNRSVVGLCFVPMLLVTVAMFMYAQISSNNFFKIAAFRLLFEVVHSSHTGFHDEHGPCLRSRRAQRRRPQGNLLPYSHSQLVSPEPKAMCFSTLFMLMLRS